MNVISLSRTETAAHMPLASVKPEFAHSLLRFITAGSVDDGKSTLIGRLLYDSHAVATDHLDALQAQAARRGATQIDLSLLTDGLEAEREQGITIDVAYRYFSSKNRKFIVGDAPGHEEYTRNMVTAASTADAAILLVDARNGIVTQTRRHSYLARLLGIEQLILAVNKMDMVGWQEQIFDRIAAEYLGFTSALGCREVCAIPLSALTGDNVVSRGGAMPWYRGPSLLERLESLPAADRGADLPLRLPIQRVSRLAGEAAGSVSRVYQGTIASGTLHAGQFCRVLPSGQEARVRSLNFAGRTLTSAGPQQAVVVELDRDVDICRGDMLVADAAPPQLARDLLADICWFGEEPLDLRRKYLVKQTTRCVGARFAELIEQWDVNRLQFQPVTSAMCMNDIFKARIKLQQPLFVDAYRHNRTTGSFIVIDPVSFATVGAGVIQLSDSGPAAA